MKKYLVLICCLFAGVYAYAQTSQPTSSRSMLAKENLQEYFSVMFFDAAEAAEFNIVVDNIVAGYIGNRRLRQTIDYVKDQTNTGICVRCFIESDQRWAKVLNFKTPRGNCDTTNGTASIMFQIALSPLGTGKLAEYQPSISYRVVNGYDPQLKEENIEAFEKYLRDTLPPMTRKEFFPKLNNQLVTALLKLMGSNAAPVMVELKPQNAWGYDNYPSPAIYYSYEKAQIHGKEKFVYWASIPKGQVLKIQGHVEQPLMDSTTMERMLQLKRNSSVQQNFSTKDTLPEFDVSGFSTGDNTVKAVYQLQEGKGVDILAGQLNVAAYKQEKVKLIIVPIKGTQFTDGTGLQAALDNIYRQAVVNWDVTVDNSFNYTQDIHINPESNSQDPYDNSMDKVIAAYKKTDGYSRKARILFLIDKFSSGLADEIGYMPFYDQFGFVKQSDGYGKLMDTEKLARWIAHELGHGAFGLRHTFDPQVGLAENYGNLMDYTDSTRLCKFQWDIIHDSDAGAKEFGSADEAMGITEDYKKYLSNKWRDFILKLEQEDPQYSFRGLQKIEACQDIFEILQVMRDDYRHDDWDNNFGLMESETKLHCLQVMTACSVTDWKEPLILEFISETYWPKQEKLLYGLVDSKYNVEKKMLIEQLYYRLNWSENKKLGEILLELTKEVYKEKGDLPPKLITWIEKTYPGQRWWLGIDKQKEIKYNNITLQVPEAFCSNNNFDFGKVKEVAGGRLHFILGEDNDTGNPVLLFVGNTAYATGSMPTIIPFVNLSMDMKYSQQFIVHAYDEEGMEEGAYICSNLQEVEAGINTGFENWDSNKRFPTLQSEEAFFNNCVELSNLIGQLTIPLMPYMMQSTTGFKNPVKGFKYLGGKIAKVNVGWKNAKRITKLWTSIDESGGILNGKIATYYDVNVTYQAVRERVGASLMNQGVLEFHLNIPSKLQQQGLASSIISKAIKEEFATKVKGWWKTMDIYSEGESSNLTIFKQKLRENLSPMQAAFETPTGKILKMNGFNKVEILKNTSDEVIVIFKIE